MAPTYPFGKCRINLIEKTQVALTTLCGRHILSRLHFSSADNIPSMSLIDALLFHAVCLVWSNSFIHKLLGPSFSLLDHHHRAFFLCLHRVSIRLGAMALFKQRHRRQSFTFTLFRLQSAILPFISFCSIRLNIWYRDYWLSCTKLVYSITLSLSPSPTNSSRQIYHIDHII